MIYWENNAFYVQFVFIPNLISYFLIIFIIPINIAGLFIEKILINLGKIPNKKISKFSNKQKIIFYIIITLSIFAFLVSLGGWIHTLIPYTPNELEQLRYD